MRSTRDGIAASPGLVTAPAFVLQWEVPRIPHTSITSAEVAAEIERFAAARERVKSRLREIQEEAAERLGAVEANIFDPQLLMIDDPALVDATNAYISENLLSAPRAFELRVLEFQAEWRRSGHPMMMDRLSDLLDVQTRISRALLGAPEPELVLASIPGEVILVARDLTPTLMVQFDRSVIRGIAIDGGTRTSHSAILARSLGIPAVVSLGDLSRTVRTGQQLILDGYTGRVIIEPGTAVRELYREREVRVREWERELTQLAELESYTADQQKIDLLANIDLPEEARLARTHGAQGIGLFRTEFLVVGKSTVPAEEEQYQAYRRAVEAFPNEAVYIRTFDLGGDKFPLFLDMPPEENPFLGWRAIRVCLDLPDLFRTQLRALLRASAHGDLRIMLPLVNQIEEIRQTRDLLREVEEELRAESTMYDPNYQFGIMIETPAAALTAAELARYADFFSIGTNDLIQYTLAVDRGNSRLAPRFTPFHPAVLRILQHVATAGADAGIDVAVCGELASHPLGVYLLLGLGIRGLSVAPASLPEIKKVIRSIPMAEAQVTVATALEAETTEEVTQILTSGLARWLDLSLFSGRWSDTTGEGVIAGD